MIAFVYGSAQLVDRRVVLGLVEKFDAFPQMLSVDRIIAEDQKNNGDVPFLGRLSYRDEVFAITLRRDSGRKGANILNDLR